MQRQPESFGVPARKKATSRHVFSVALALFLSLLMAVALVPFSLFSGVGQGAAEGKAAAAGQGNQQGNWQKAFAAEATSAVDTSWYNTSATAFTLNNPGQLYGLARIVNGTADGIAQDGFANKAITLAGDLNLSTVSEAWVPIGVMGFSGSIANPALGTARPFLGTFDGADHTISGLTIEGDGLGQALFQYVGAGAVLKDFTVSGNVSGSYYVAGVAAFSAGTIEKVTSKVTINATNDVLGGIVAEALNGFTITDCRNEGTITNASLNRSSGRLGGMVGKAEASGTIRRCANVAQIDGYQYVGGIIGGQFGNVTVEQCYNTADLTSRSFGKVYLGGIAGKSEGGSIANCYNTGDLYDAHWATGHIRAIGGIAGCEEGRAGGVTAIRNCYTTGFIEMYTDNMSGPNNIYEVGNISGGNNSTGYNSMRYEQCFYLEERIAIADPSNPGYELWGDGYKTDPLIWDTTYITPVTVATLKSPAFIESIGSAFAADTNNVNEGYPVLAWQLGQDTDDELYAINVESYPEEYADYVQVSAEVLAAGEMVSITIDSAVAAHNVKPYQVTVTDSAGNAVAATDLTGDLMDVSFSMPRQAVTLRVVFGNDVLGEGPGEGYELFWPQDLDAIWRQPGFLSAAGDTSTNIPAGSSVYVTVNKNPSAVTSSLVGLLATVGATGASGTTGDGLAVETVFLNSENGTGYTGSFVFTMPAADVTLTPQIDYLPLELSTRVGTEDAVSIKTYSRADMLNLAEKDLYYSGYSSDTEGFIGRAEQGVTLTSLLASAGLTLKQGQTLRLTSADGLISDFTWEKLYKSQRYYYPNLIAGTTSAEKAVDKTPIDAMLVIKGIVAEEGDGALEDQECDTLNAYRFVFGQTEADFNDGIPSVEGKVNDDMAKYLTGVTIITPVGNSGSGDLDGDGISTASEALQVARFVISGTAGLTPTQIASVDMDNDGALTMADVVRILRKAAGL
jgi:hypothetical protein